MLGMNSLQLELEIGRMAGAMMTRNSEIGKDLICHLRNQLTVEAMAGVIIVSIERVLWFDTDSVSWTIQNLIPADVMQEIKKIISLSIFKRLIGRGFMPGKDFSVDANGGLLMNDLAKTAISLGARG